MIPLIETYTGKFVNPLDLKDEDISILDIAHALSLTCRFNGHCNRFYSVAAHSIRVFALVNYGSRATQRAALLHDAAEAYLPDVPRPIKQHWPHFIALEEQVMKTITRVFHLQKSNWIDIKTADNIMLAIEAKFLMSSKGEGWGLSEPENPYVSDIRYPELIPSEYETAFLTEFFTVEYNDS